MFASSDLLTHSFTSSGESITYTPDNDYQNDNTEIYIDNQYCNNVETCSTCLSCDSSHSCPLGSLCLAYAEYQSLFKYACFDLCAGESDSTCPCGNYCKEIGIYYSYENKMDILSICTPTKDLSKDILCPKSYKPSIQCNSLIHSLTYLLPFSLTHTQVVLHATLIQVIVLL